MPRKILIRTDEFPYHITSRSNNKSWFSLPMSITWQIALTSLQYAHAKHPVKLHAFVLMSNHYHMLLSTPNCNIDSFMQAFNKKFSDKLKSETKNINRMFGGRYKWSIIQSSKYLANVYRYIYQNPLRAKIVNNCQDYPFSTLHVEVHQQFFPLPLHQLLEHESEKLLKWYNNPFNENDTDGIRRALKHARFELKKHGDSKKETTLCGPKI